MKVLDIIITLQDDCVFSERNATEGGHSALDYIPGSALLGAVAAQAYQADDLNTAFNWFHSGKLRFGNAYPLTDNGYQAYPIPACWHEAKNQPSTEDKSIDADKVWRLDLMSGQLPEDKQPKQMRQGYVALNGELAEPKKTLRMKTAIDGDKGRAKEGMLFGYDALRAGQRFHTQIQIDETLAAEAMPRLKAIFETPLLLGRSRSAEYGHAKAQVIQGFANASRNPAPEGNEITLWLQSDLMLLDKYGQPNLCPSSDDFGLPAGEYLANKSFVRTRCYSTWNAFKHGYEMERQVICKGGVLVFKLDKAPSDAELETLQQKLSQGVGLEKQAGLGQVWLNPPLLSSPQPEFKSDATPLLVMNDLGQKDKLAETELIAWLRKRSSGKTAKQDAAKAARDIAEQYVAHLKSARALKGLLESDHVGPSVAQWSALLSSFKRESNYTKLVIERSQKYEQVKHSNAKDKKRQLDQIWPDSFKPEGEGWSNDLSLNGDDKRTVSFHEWFVSIIKENQSHYLLCALIREIQGKIKNQKGGQS